MPATPPPRTREERHVPADDDAAGRASGGPDRRPTRRPNRLQVLVAVGALVVVAAAVVVLALPEPPAPEELTLTEALAVVHDGRVDSALLDEDARRLVMTDADELTETSPPGSTPTRTLPGSPLARPC